MDHWRWAMIREFGDNILEGKANTVKQKRAEHVHSTAALLA